MFNFNLGSRESAAGQVSTRGWGEGGANREPLLLTSRWPGACVVVVQFYTNQAFVICVREPITFVQIA